jgi:hypothetical protein
MNGELESQTIQAKGKIQMSLHQLPCRLKNGSVSGHDHTDEDRHPQHCV